MIFTKYNNSISDKDTLNAMYVTKSLNADHEDLVHDVAYDFYGKRMATCSSDQKVKVWDQGCDNHVDMQSLSNYRTRYSGDPHKKSIANKQTMLYLFLPPLYFKLKIVLDFCVCQHVL